MKTGCILLNILIWVIAPVVLLTCIVGGKDKKE